MDSRKRQILLVLSCLLLLVSVRPSSTSSSTSSNADTKDKKKDDSSSSDSEAKSGSDSESGSVQSSGNPMLPMYSHMMPPYPGMSPFGPPPPPPPSPYSSIVPYSFRPLHGPPPPHPFHMMGSHPHHHQHHSSMMGSLSQSHHPGMLAPVMVPMSSMSSLQSQMGSPHHSSPLNSMESWRRSWDDFIDVDRLLHSESNMEQLGILGDPIEIDEEELREFEQSRRAQAAARRTAGRRNQPNSGMRVQQPPPPAPQFSEPEPERPAATPPRFHREDPYEPMQMENRYDRGPPARVDPRYRDPMEYDDRPPHEGPPAYVRRSLLAEKMNHRQPAINQPIRHNHHPGFQPGSDYDLYDDKKA